MAQYPNQKSFVMNQRQLTFGEAVQRAFQNYCNFSGRASRSEYWWFALFAFIAGIAAQIVGGIFSDSMAQILSSIVSLGLFLPNLGLLFRRLHDNDHTGWWCLIALTGIGCILLLIWCLQDSQPTENRYGRVPNVIE